MGFATIDEAIREIAVGRMIVVVDDEDRENEGDFIMAAEKATPEAINFMAREAGVPLCAPMTADRLEALSIPLMVSENTSPHGTAFTVSVDLKVSGHSGSSAYDRAATVRALADPSTLPHHLARPGHVFPLRAADGGVLRRSGHTEAAVDLVRLAGLAPVAVLGEIMDPGGHMANLEYLQQFAGDHAMKIVTIKDLIAYRRQRERLIERSATAKIPTSYGEFTCHVYRSLVDGQEYVAFVRGDIAGEKDVLVRMHSQCLTGDAFGSSRCDCGAQLHEALRMIEEEGRGVVVYIMAHEGRGIGLMHKIRAYSLQEQGHDTVDANVELGFLPDQRDYGIGMQVLSDLGVTTMRLLTNNPAKYHGLEGFGLSITQRVPLQTRPTAENIRYLRTKRDRLGHLLEGLEQAPEEDRLPPPLSAGP